MIDLEAARLRWHPIAASTDLHYRHVFQAQLLGRELAVWRADDGHVNAWENRCLHRGVRLSIGINDGTELVCQYHGWRYANRTAGCTYIPAHPANAPARTICNNTYPVLERFGLIWSKDTSTSRTMQTQPDPARGGSDALGALTEFFNQNSTATTPLRPVAVNAPLHVMAKELAHFYSTNTGMHAAGQSNSERETSNDLYSLLLQNSNQENRSGRGDNKPDTGAQPETVLVFCFQPVDAMHTVIRGIACGIDDNSCNQHKVTALLKQHSHWLNQFRDDIELKIATDPAPLAWIPIIPRVSESHANLPEHNLSGSGTPLRTTVKRIDTVAHNVKQFILESIDSSLPAAQPGAHIDISLPNGMINQYSLINGPGQTNHYAVAVKELPDSKGGSQALHHTVRVGDVLATSVPRNNFTLRRDAEHTLLIAGGIGITPLLSMARALHHSGLSYSLHHFVTSDSDALFKEELEAMFGTFHLHTGLDAAATCAELKLLLASPVPHHHIYLCGPEPMLSAGRQIAAEHGWNDNTIHFEYFGNAKQQDTSKAFTVELAKSGLSLDIPSGVTLLDTLMDNNISVPSSCRQGACGTCKVTVIDGEPDHQDVYLSDTDKARSDCMMSCVSRARSEKLVLDL